MKSKLLLLALASLLAGSASAVTTTYTFTTGATATSNGIANSSGVAFQNSTNVSFAGAGTVGWGYFNITDTQITAATSSATLVTAFQNWNVGALDVGITSLFNAPGPGATSNRGTFNFNAAARDLTTATGSNFASKNMYVFVGNGLSYASSSEFLILKTTFLFDSAESGVAPFVKTLTNTNATPLVGTSVLNVFTTGSDASQTPGWQTAAVIPEPSAALLGALGALGLLRRRRN